MRPCKYFALSFFCINVFLSFAFETFGFPLSEHIRRQGASSDAPEPTPLNTTHEIQSIETTQSFTSTTGITIQRCTVVGTPTILSDGEPAVIITQNCSSTFIPSSHSSTTSVESISTALLTSTSSELTSTLPASSAFSVSSVSTSVGVASSSGTIVNSLSSSLAGPTSSSISNPLIDSSASAGNKAPPKGNLSSLPIFIGAFGGVASLALIAIGYSVYRPFLRFNNTCLDPRTWIRRMKKRKPRDSENSNSSESSLQKPVESFEGAESTLSEP